MKIDYQKKVDQAKLNVVKEILQNVQKKLGAHLNEIHISITTLHPDLILSNSLKKLHPKEMTLIIYNNYDQITVHQNSFELTQNLIAGKETITIPFDSIKLFIDHANEYALKFTPYIAETIKQTSDNKIVTIDFGKK